MQDRWDALREAKAALAREDYAAAMKTGVVTKKLRSIGHGKDAQVVAEYEINTALIESLNSVEKRSAIETGQEVDRGDIGVGLGMADKAEILRRAFTLDELEAMEARINAAQQQLLGPAGVSDVQPVPDKPHTQGRSDVAAGEAVDQAGSEGKRDRAAGVFEDGVVPTVPKAPKSWRD